MYITYMYFILKYSLRNGWKDGVCTTPVAQLRAIRIFSGICHMTAGDLMFI